MQVRVRIGVSALFSIATTGGQWSVLYRDYRRQSASAIPGKVVYKADSVCVGTCGISQSPVWSLRNPLAIGRGAACGYVQGLLSS